MRGSGFETPATLESMTKSRCLESPASARARATEPLEFEITPTVQPLARARARASTASGSAWWQSPIGALKPRRHSAMARRSASSAMPSASSR
jgi:hypothetical protein